MNDWELLQNYAGRGSEAAFRTLVERYLGLVHSVAMRQVQDAQLAEEVSQAVFILLARKAASLKESVLLSGWLFRTTRFVAARARRAEQRRHEREKEAYEMQNLTTTDENWRRIASMLDEALEHLGTADRNLLLLRFYEGKNHKEAGAALGLSEEAARKRGARALEKLRARFARHGTVLSATALAAVLTANAVQAAPAALTGTVLAAGTAKASASTVLVSALVRETLGAWHWARAKAAAAWLASGAGVAVAIALIAQHPGSGRLAANVKAENNPAVTAGTIQAEASASITKVDPPARDHSGTLRFHVVAKDSGEPVAGARLALLRVPNWDYDYSLTTDDQGACDVPLPRGLSRLDVGVLSPGWGARFATWKDLENDPLPAEYTLRVDRLTNSTGGWLRDAHGKPVSGAQVFVQFAGTGDAAWRETPRERVGVMGWAPVASTDRDGHWSCSVIPPENPGFGLEARHPDFATTTIISRSPGVGGNEKDRPAIEQLWAGRLLTVLNEALAVTGRVTDEAGKPISNARIEHNPASEGALKFRTDGNGQFVIPKLKAGLCGFAVSAEGFAPEYVKVDVRAGVEPVRVALKPGAVLRLRVVDPKGTEVPGATVIMEQWGEHRDALNWSAETGPDGRLEWNSAPRGEELELCARKAGWCYTRSIHLTADGDEHLITLTPALTLFGRVTDAQTRLPVEHFKVIPGYGKGRGESVWERLDTRLGTQGEFKVVFAESRQPWQLRVEAQGYEPLVSGPIPPDYSGAYELTLKQVDLSNGMRGMVLLPDGSPAANARVALLTLDYGASLQPGHFREEGFGNLTNTDSAGRFAFAPNPRAHSVAAVTAAGFAKTRVKDPVQPVTLKLQSWGRVEGTVAEAARTRPIEYVYLTDDTTWNYRGSVSLDINAFQAKPDAEGHFVFEQAPPGFLSLFINRQMGTPLVCRTEIAVRREKRLRRRWAARGEP